MQVVVSRKHVLRVRPLEVVKTPSSVVLQNAKRTLVHDNPNLEYEDDFGCGVCLIGEQVESMPEGETIPVVFDYNCFVNKETRERHDFFDFIQINADGSMCGLVIQVATETGDS